MSYAPDIKYTPKTRVVAKAQYGTLFEYSVAMTDHATAIESQNIALLFALRELHAMVKGECPSLLDEDRGGSAHLDAEIERLLAA